MNGPPAELPPDAGPTATYDTYPAVFVAPFHYENPVTGNPLTRSPPRNSLRRMPPTPRLWGFPSRNSIAGSLDSKTPMRSNG